MYDTLHPHTRCRMNLPKRVERALPTMRTAWFMPCDGRLVAANCECPYRELCVEAR